MDNYLITAIILCFYLKTVLTEHDLQQQNAVQDQLNPINDLENADASKKDQDKRTIFNSANYGWAKHVGLKPTGQRYILGYSPVDLKYTPVIRPLKHQGYVYGKPTVHFHARKPVLLRPAQPVHPLVWKPPHHQHVVAKPTGVVHSDHVHLKPVHHVDHVHGVHVPHADHVHNVPVHVDHVHHTPVHVDHVHAAPVHVDHVHPAPIHPVHVHPVPIQPVALPQPIALPQPVVVPVQQPLVPVLPPPQIFQSPLFEVTKPNLGVLPLGAAFPSPILRQLPHPHPVVPQHVVPAAVPLPQPLPVPRPAALPPHLVSQPAYPPGTIVEYHGSTNFVNQVPLPPVPVNAVQPALPPHLHLQYPHIHQHHQHIPAPAAPALPHEQHDVQTPIIPPNHHHFLQQPFNPNQFQQQLPQETPSHFQPDHVNNPNVYQQLPGNIQHTQFQSEQQLPQDSGPQYQPADQVSTQQFFQGSINPQQGNFEQLDNQDGGYVYQQPDTPFGQQAIQPGNTDLQFPVHLPQHPGFVHNSRQFQQEPSQLQSVFRPSIQLEPPYKK